MPTKLVKCTCKHIFQDEMYGIGNRIGNEMRTGQFKCTVCGTICGSQGVTQSQKAIIKDAAQQKANKEISKKSSKERNVKKSSLKGGKR